MPSVTNVGFPAGAAVTALSDIVGGIEASSLKITLVAGTTATTNIAVSGITQTDVLVSVIQFDIASDTGSGATGNKVQNVVDRSSEASITSAGNIQLSTTNTTGDVLAVVWRDITA